MKTERLAELSLLTSMALIMFIIELRLPNLTAIPGAKLGLANIVTVYAVYRFSAKETLLIVLARVFMGAFFASNFSAVIYSLAGALLCLCGMIPLKKFIPIENIFVCSAVGALLHNTGQIVTAALMMRTTAVFGYYPHLIVSGGIAGLFTGLCAGYLIKRLPEKFKRRNENEPNDFT